MTERETWEPQAAVSANTHRMLPLLTREFFEAGDAASVEARTHSEIHQFRLKVKRFRYTLELFQPFYGRGLDARLKELKQLQQVLGLLNDAVTTQELLSGSLCTHSETSVLSTFLKQEIERLTKEFRAVWKRDFTPASTKQRWLRYWRRALPIPVKVEHESQEAAPSGGGPSDA